MYHQIRELVRQSQKVQSAIYSSDTVFTQVLTPAILSLGSQLQAFSIFQHMSSQNGNVSCLYFLSIASPRNLQLLLILSRQFFMLLWCFTPSFFHK